MASLENLLNILNVYDREGSLTAAARHRRWLLCLSVSNLIAYRYGGVIIVFFVFCLADTWHFSGSHRKCFNFFPFPFICPHNLITTTVLEEKATNIPNVCNLKARYLHSEEFWRMFALSPCLLVNTAWKAARKQVVFLYVLYITTHGITFTSPSPFAIAVRCHCELVMSRCWGLSDIMLQMASVQLAISLRPSSDIFICY